MGRDRLALALLVAPAIAFLAAFFLLPLVLMLRTGATGPQGWSTYAIILSNDRYLASLWKTVALAASVTAASMVISGIAGVFLARTRFRGRRLLIAFLTLPLAFPGVVIGFMVVLLAGRQGVIGELSVALTGERLVFAYSLAGLFVGYLYVSIPRTVLTVMAAAEKLDPALEEAARSLGAGLLARFRTVVLPNATPGILAGSLMVVTLYLGEFNMTLMLHTPFTMTLPVGLADSYASMRLEIGSAYTLVFLVLLIPLLVAMQWASDRAFGLEMSR